jgi:hypothetical protein
MPDLEKPDNQNNPAQSGTNQEQKVIEMPEHVSQPENNSTPQQQVPEQNKESLQKNERFREPTFHEKKFFTRQLKK